MKKMIMIGALALCPFACQETLEPLDPVVDTDDYSELARTLRLRNQAIRDATDPAPHDRALDDLIAKLQQEEQDPELLSALAVLSGLLANNPDRQVNQAFATRVLQRAFADTRDTIYILYGDLSDQEIEDERTGWNRTIEEMLPWRGYRVQIDRETTFEDWQQAVLARDAAGFIWRSHGNLEAHPYSVEPDHFMARVKTRGGSRKKIFAADWQALLPEGLGLLVLATCMSDGLYLPEDFDLVEDRRGAKLNNSRIWTFETEIRDRALTYRGYRGPSFSPGIGSVSWFALRHFLPQRLIDPQDFPDNMGQAVDLGVVPLEWLPHFIDMAQAGDARVFETLGKLSEELGRPHASANSFDWVAWWESEGTQNAFASHQRLVDARPPWDLVWAHLWAAFEQYRDDQGGIPKDGPDCLRAWFHCILDRKELPERLSENDLWQMALPPDTTENYPCPLPRELLVDYDPDTRTLTHNLTEIMDTIDPTQISCLSTY